jgi:hypothetical protein
MKNNFINLFAGCYLFYALNGNRTRVITLEESHSTTELSARGVSPYDMIESVHRERLTAQTVTDSKGYSLPCFWQGTNNSW